MPNMTTMNSAASTATAPLRRERSNECVLSRAGRSSEDIMHLPCLPEKICSDAAPNECGIEIFQRRVFETYPMNRP